MSERLREIAERLRRLPELHAVKDAKDLPKRWASHWGDQRDSDSGWTVSDSAAQVGWDSGHPGYGLPRWIAQDIAALRGDVEWLLRELANVYPGPERGQLLDDLKRAGWKP